MNLNNPFDVNSLDKGDASGDNSTKVMSPGGINSYLILCVDKEDEKVEEWISRIRSEIEEDNASSTMDTSKYTKTLSLLIEEIKKEHNPEVTINVPYRFLLLNVRFCISFLRCVLTTVSMQQYFVDLGFLTLFELF